MIRSEIGPWLAWLIFGAAFLVNIVVNMSQMAAMVEGAYGAFGSLPPATAGIGFGLITVALTAASVTLAVLGGYKRVERVMVFLLVAKLVCFIIVATKGLLDWYTWPALAHGLVPHVPADVPVVGGNGRVREGFTQMLAIAGQALPPTVFLTYGYLHSNAGYTSADAKRAFWKTVYNLGFLWGLFSVVVIVAGTTALHNVYTGNGPSFLGVSHFSQIESIPVAGQVLGPAFPGVLGFLAPRFFSLGLVGAGFTTFISVSLTMTYICLDVARRDWHFTRENKTFQAVFALWIAVPALLTPFWALPALLKALIAMIGNLLLAPAAVAVIFYFVNRRQMGEFKANAGRNVLLGADAGLRARARGRGRREVLPMSVNPGRGAIVAAIESTGVVAVVRLNDAGAFREVAAALVEGGVRAIEVTMTVPRAVALIESLAAVGAGTT